MAIQMIFCVETTKKADTDSIYLTEILNFRYAITNQVKISKIYMGTKSKYNSKEVLKEIERKTKEFIIGETKIIYCIDTDAYESNYEHQRELEDIERFCAQKGYELIWFCHDVEDVFLGRQITDSEKVKEAATFRRKRMIEQVDDRKLAVCALRKNTSNILTVLDKYLEKK